MTKPVANSQFATAAANISDLVQLRHAVTDLAFFPRKIVNSQLAGQVRSQFRGRGMDFEEVRHYQPGDDVRSIDWRVTARTETPHTKVFREERERPVFVIADLRRTMLFGSVQLKASSVCQLAAALAWAGINSNDRVGALLFGTQQQITLRPRRSHHNVLQLIHGLHDLCTQLPSAESDRFSLAKLLQEARRIAHPGASLFVVSDFHDLDDASREHLYSLTRHCDLTLCQVFDPLERQLPPAGLYPIVSNGQRRTFNTRNRQLQQRCSALFDQHQQQLQLLAGTAEYGHAPGKYRRFRTRYVAPQLFQKSQQVKAAGMNAAPANPLAQLRDIHLPEATSWWPLAPSLWVLLILIAALLGTGLWLLWRNYQRNHYRRLAEKILAKHFVDYRSHSNQIQLCQQVVNTLRRYLLSTPKAKLQASLPTGQLLQCRNRKGQALFSAELSGQIEQLLYAAKPPSLAESAISQLQQSARRWLKEGVYV